jgi:Holliday junction resolvasome RuvABC endonuclease subunit
MSQRCGRCASPVNCSIMKTHVTVDPGLEGTGLAFWKWGEEYWTRCVPPYATRVLTVPHTHADAEWDDRARILTAAFGEELEARKVRVVYIEYPHYFDSDVGNKSMKSGNLGKLLTLVGMYMTTCLVLDIECNLVDVGWKGQMKKPQVDARIKRKIKREYPNHASDAVGLGLYLKGHFVTRKGDVCP